MATQQAHSD